VSLGRKKPKEVKMALEQIADKVIETDTLVIGGGIGGCCTAVKAAENGLNVTLVEKGNTERSGNAGQGIDHYDVGSVPYEGLTPLELLRHWREYQSLLNGDGRWGNPNLIYKYYKNGFWALEELEKLGIPMKWDDGQFYWIPQTWYKGYKMTLRVHWQNVKPLLSKALREKGVNVLEWTMVIDLLTYNGAVVGATAVNIRTGEFIIIMAKATVIATGIFQRCYNGEAPMSWQYKLRYDGCPASLSGDGWAIAYRAGAELTNMDITGWSFRIRDDLMISQGNFTFNDGIPAKYINCRGEEFSFATASKYDQLEQEGLTPIYRSLVHLPDDFHKRIEVSYVDEKMVDFKIAEERGFNPRRHWYELVPLKPLSFMTSSGIYTDEDYEASLKGLYAVGDCAATLHSCAQAAVAGFLTAESLPSFVNKASEPVVDEAQVERQKQTTLSPLSVKGGTEPIELESAIRYICERYVSIFKSEGKLREGVRRLKSLRRVFLPALMAKNPHELMRCLECRNVMDLAELHIEACLERKETRGNFIRLDYPRKDPSRDSRLTYQRLEEGKAVLEIREVPDLRQEYRMEGE